jgi:hypothetical protein
MFWEAALIGIGLDKSTNKSANKGTNKGIKSTNKSVSHNTTDPAQRQVDVDLKALRIDGPQNRFANIDVVKDHIDIKTKKKAVNFVVIGVTLIALERM